MPITPRDPRSGGALVSRGRAARTSVAIGLATLPVWISACADEPAPEEVTREGYVAELGAICAATDERLDELPEPSDEAGVSAFTDMVAEILREESDLARGLAVPDELDADHRAFVRNTDDQASRWERLGHTSAADPAFGELTVEIGELTLGRNDLVEEMGVPACTRSAA